MAQNKARNARSARTEYKSLLPPEAIAELEEHLEREAREAHEAPEVVTLEVREFEPYGFSVPEVVSVNVVPIDVDLHEHVEREAALRAGVDLNAGEVPEQDEPLDGESPAGQRGTKPPAVPGAGIEKAVRECRFAIEILGMTKRNLAVCFDRGDERLDRLHQIIDSRIAEVKAEKARLENSLNEKKGD